jgi:apolipoprotein N-acyltransferase
MRRELLFAALTAVLLSLAYPPLHFGLLAYWALVPFFFLLENKSYAPAFRWGCFTGFLAAIGSVNALVLDNVVTLLLAVFVQPFYFALYAVLHACGRQLLGDRTLFAIPFLWVAVEFLERMSHFGFSILNLGYTHPQYLLFFEDAASAAALLLSFWICCLNVLIYAMLKSLHNRRRATYLLVATIVLLLIPLSCSYRALDIPDGFDRVVEMCITLCSR